MKAISNQQQARNLSRAQAFRRRFIEATLLAAATLVLRPREAQALSLADLTQKDAAAGLRTALEKGAQVAVASLGRENGFWSNDQVRIPLPQWLEKGERALKLLGRSKDVDDLRLGVNRAAEQAVPQAKALLVNAVKTMSVDDAKKILTGGDHSVTDFFQQKTREPLTGKFLPIVSKVTGRIGLAKQYNGLAAQVSAFGVVKLEQATIEQHVTGKALDGLYYMIGEEEKKIRTDPVGTGSEILKKVFGALGR
ncbi:MAG: DUF4197 domain-containing protein [Betaproteobacteria bacterium]|nr:DUF4197 domain-containing protein [Betaproteobacteria bacterium]